MAGRILIDDGGRALDTNANAGGLKIKAFLAGTSTAASLYTTSALSTPHASPVVASAAGFFAQMWADEDQLLDIKLYAAADVTYTTPLRTFLNVTPQGPGELTVSVNYYGSVNDGTTDDTAAFQAAHDALTNGGRVIVPASANAYRVSAVEITNTDITFELEPGATIKKYGIGGTGGDGIGDRGMFIVANLLNANFTLEGGGPASIIDMNCEGPTGIGVAGRIANTYADMTVAGTKGIAATGNAAVFALRATHITVRNVAIKNTSESGILYRNCSDTLTEYCSFENIAHYGVEFSCALAADDDGSGTMPDRSRNRANFCTFTDIWDMAIGTGNGIAIGGGGTTTANIREFEAVGNLMRRCQRAVNLELPSGSYYYEGGRIECRAYDMLQGGIGLINVRGFHVDFVGRDIGAAPTAALYTGAFNYGDIYGVVISGANSTGNFARVDVEDDRNTKTYRATDGAITSGDATLTSAGASFATTDVGRWVGVMGAGPSGTCLHARIASRTSGTSVELEYNASATVSGATYAYGGATRHGVLVNNGGDLILTGRVKAGILSGLSSEPASAALYLATPVFGRVDATGLDMVAPTTVGTVPTGVYLAGALTGSGLLDRAGARVTGFTNDYVGTETNKADVENKFYAAVATAVVPSATTNTYGTDVVLSATGFLLEAVQGLDITFGGTFDGGGETVTVQIVGNRHDSVSSTTITLTATATGNQSLTVAQLNTLQPDNTPLKSISVRAKSSIASTIASVAASVRALKG